MAHFLWNLALILPRISSRLCDFLVFPVSRSRWLDHVAPDIFTGNNLVCGNRCTLSFQHHVPTMNHFHFTLSCTVVAFALYFNVLILRTTQYTYIAITQLKPYAQ